MHTVFSLQKCTRVHILVPQNALACKFVSALLSPRQDPRSCRPAAKEEDPHDMFKEMTA